MKGQIKAGKGTLVGNAGEYYVMAELLKRGAVAALAPRNAPAFDILATKNDSTVRIRVKTKSEEFKGWKLAAKPDGAIFLDLHEKDDFTILVNLTAKIANMEFFIFPTAMLDKLIRDDFERWINTPGVRGQPHNPDNRLRVFSNNEHPEEFNVHKEQWDLLWG